MRSSRSSLKGGSDISSNSMALEKNYSFLYHYIKILFFKAVKWWPIFLFLIFGFEKIIFYLGDGASWNQYS